MQVTFPNKRISSTFFIDVHRYFVAAGFDFLGSRKIDFNNNDFNFIDTTLEELSNRNQAMYEEEVRLNFPKKAFESENIDSDEFYETNYKQIVFKREGCSELLGIWTADKDGIMLSLLMPEDEISFYMKGAGRFYNQDKITPLAQLARKLWEDGWVSTVQTMLECDDPIYDAADIMNGIGILFRPFAVLPESAYKNFPKNYFNEAQIAMLANNGVYIEQTDRVV